MRRLALAAVAAAFLGLPAFAAPPQTIQGSVAICDPWNPQNCLQPSNSGGTASASSLPVIAGGYTTIAGGTFTRPANTTAYASGQLVANSTTAGSVVPITITGASRATAGTGMIRRVRLSKSSTGLTNAQFRVHVYRDLPTVTNGDGGAWLTTHSTYIGCFDVTMDKAFTDAAKGTGAPCVGSEINFDTSGSANLYSLIEARAAYTPVSAETFTAAFEILQN